MTTVEQPVEQQAFEQYGRKGSILASWLSSTDHKSLVTCT